MNHYTKKDLRELKGTSLWRNSIDDTQVRQLNNKPTYKLYATGEADASNGRTYIALPVNMKIGENEKKKYNLW